MKKLEPFLYMFFRLFPFILICYFLISSIFHQDVKIVFYLAGLLLSCLVSWFFSDIFMTLLSPGDGSSTMTYDEVCKVTFLADSMPFSAIPLGVNVLAFTVGFLIYVIQLQKTWTYNLASLLFLIIMMLAEAGWNVQHGCHGAGSTFAALAWGVGSGCLWGYILQASSLANMIYFNGLSSAEMCSRPSKQQFVCVSGGTSGSTVRGGKDSFIGGTMIEGMESNPGGGPSPSSSQSPPSSLSFASGELMYVSTNGVSILTVSAPPSQPTHFQAYLVVGTMSDNTNSTFAHPIFPDTGYFTFSGTAGTSGTTSGNGVYSISTKDESAFAMSTYSVFSMDGNAGYTSIGNINVANGGTLTTLNGPLNPGTYLSVVYAASNLSEQLSQVWCFHSLFTKDLFLYTEVKNESTCKLQIKPEKQNFQLSISCKKQPNTPKFNVAHVPLSQNVVYLVRNIQMVTATNNGYTCSLLQPGLFYITIIPSLAQDADWMCGFYVFYTPGQTTMVSQQKVDNLNHFKITGLANAQFNIAMNDTTNMDTFDVASYVF